MPALGRFSPCSDLHPLRTTKLPGTRKAAIDSFVRNSGKLSFPKLRAKAASLDLFDVGGISTCTAKCNTRGGCSRAVLRSCPVQRQLFLRIDDNYFSRSTTITFSRLRSAATPGGQSRLRPGSSVLGMPPIDPSRSVGHYRLPGALAVIFS